MNSYNVVSANTTYVYKWYMDGVYCNSQNFVYDPVRHLVDNGTVYHDYSSSEVANSTYKNRPNGYAREVKVEAYLFGKLIETAYASGGYATSSEI